jgi:hypothetical protein
MPSSRYTRRSSTAPPPRSNTLSGPAFTAPMSYGTSTAAPSKLPAFSATSASLASASG